MRCLLDTCIYIYLVTDRESLHPDVLSLLSEPDSLWCMSAESVRELIVAFNNKGWGNRKGKCAAWDKVPTAWDKVPRLWNCFKTQISKPIKMLGNHSSTGKKLFSRAYTDYTLHTNRNEL